MKTIVSTFNKLSNLSLFKVDALNSAHLFYCTLAISTFFLIITAQLFWSTIHGDGAVYAWIVRELNESGLLAPQLPYWTQTQVFAEHPYLFFYFSSLFTQFLGYSDWALKVPNFVVAAISLVTVYKMSFWRNELSEKAQQIGLITGYVLIFNAAYMLQVSQPSLDPLAQLLALISVLSVIYFKNSFFSGLFLGLAFLTKGLELLPNLAGLFIVTCFLHRQNISQLLKVFCWQLLGCLIPIFSWLVVDQLIWNGQWLSTYWYRQFTTRFFRKGNMQSIFDFAYLYTFIQIYFFELVILVIGLFKTKVWFRKNDALFVYFISYLFFNILAFLIIKKDSSQHLTGVLLVGAVFVAEYLWELWHNTNWKFFKATPIFLFVVSLTYWSWFLVFHKNNTDIWTTIKNEAEFFAKSENKIPIVVKDVATEGYGLFFTSQWYLKPLKIYFQSEADTLLAGQEVYILENTSTGQLSKTKVIYQKGKY